MWDHLLQKFEQFSTAWLYIVIPEQINVQQGNHSIREFVTQLPSLWHQINALAPSYYNTYWHCHCMNYHCVVAKDKGIETLHTFEFLMRLRPSFEAVYGWLLNRDPILPLDTVVSLVCKGDLDPITRVLVGHRCSFLCASFFVSPY